MLKACSEEGGIILCLILIILSEYIFPKTWENILVVVILRSVTWWSYVRASVFETTKSFLPFLCRVNITWHLYLYFFFFFFSTGFQNLKALWDFEHGINVTFSLSNLRFQKSLMVMLKLRLFSVDMKKNPEQPPALCPHPNHNCLKFGITKFATKKLMHANFTNLILRHTQS